MSLLRTASVLPRLAGQTMMGRAAMAARQTRGVHIENVVGHVSHFNFLLCFLRPVRPVVVGGGVIGVEC